MSSWQPGMILRRDPRDRVWRQQFAHSLGEYVHLYQEDQYLSQTNKRPKSDSVTRIVKEPEWVREESTWVRLKRETEAARVAAVNAALRREE